MDLQSIVNVNVDFYDKKYIMLNAKQNDKNSRFLTVTCYNHGELYPMNIDEHSAFVRYKKSDGYGVFNVCEITNDKKILVELTEQMLASAGICYVDLIITNKGSARLDPDTGVVVAIDNAFILSTMTFCVDVSESAVDNSEIESTYEFNGFNAAIEKSLAEYSDVVQLAKSWTVGGTGVRDNEDADNAQYYYEQSKGWAQSASISSNTAKEHMTNAQASADAAQVAQEGATTAKINAEGFATSAEGFANTTKGYRDETVGYRIVTEGYKNAALEYRDSAEEYKNSAQTHMNQTEEYKNEAEESAVRAQRYAVGGTGTEDGEDTDNAKFYHNDTLKHYNLVTEECGKAEQNTSRVEVLTDTILTSIENYGYLFWFDGTFTYEEFLVVRELYEDDWWSSLGVILNISNSFTTDDHFYVGAGVEYEAGQLVAFATDGRWHCLAYNNFGSISMTDVASVNEVKDYLGI